MTNTSRIIRDLFILLICAAALAGSAGFAFIKFRDMQTQTRGVGDLENRPTQFGVNVSLEQYSDADLNRALALIRNGGFTLARQHFYWDDLEPKRGEFAWEKADRIIWRARENNLDLIAVIDTTPAWARDPGEADLVNAPPANPDNYARFVAAFVERYSRRDNWASRLYIQIWDNPNVHPFWGRRNADPSEYTKLLCASARAARAANPQIKILSAGLAASEELIREHPDFSDVLYLRGMYDAGARECFDILGVKPYGMWSGADDRRVAMDTFNFSRAILLREEMLARGDAKKPAWAVEFGWNALPTDWRGKSSPWGSDSEATQAARLAGAIQRARSEWGWMNAMIVQHFQPNAPSDDPVWGFALVDKNLEPRALYTAATRAIAAPVLLASFDYARFYVMLAALGVLALIAAWQAWRALWQLPIHAWWQPIETRFVALPEIVQFAALALAVVAFYYSRNAALNFVLLALVVFLFALRRDLGLAITVFTIPFYLFPKNLIGSAQFSLVELLTLASVVGWMIRQVGEKGSRGAGESYVSRFTHYISRLASLDIAIFFFILAGVLSVAIAANFGVANRELRVIVLEPALLYALIRGSNLSARALQRLADAFILSALAVSLIGLYQFLFTNYVIVGEGVRRILAVYGSPNNLALYLDRALPLVLALAWFADDPRRRIAYALAAIPIGACLFLTFSRGAWLIGLPAGLLVIGMLSGRRARLVLIALLVVAVLALIPFSQTERAQSLFQLGTGTGFFRVSVWQSGWAMILDHPILGVGLDNFLYAYPKYISADAWREPNLSHPHNVVLDFWARMGIPGLIALGWMVFEFFKKGIGELREIKGNARALVIGLIASMSAALAHGLIDAAYFYVDLAFVWMLTLGFVSQIDRND
ncbi:MAG: O-antigen ligase family protein [Chloroflexi bacterium]|nr:O-antigen ligase family protein [Chloroflexota bacterium]